MRFANDGVLEVETLMPGATREKVQDNTALPDTLKTLASYWLEICETPANSVAAVGA